ncbi:MAG: sulfurtransferase [Candidatus Bipolaricaulota bacterium]|nr:sulfurtransferase [Candidatus Bipolaricaulota bacterium]
MKPEPSVLIDAKTLARAQDDVLVLDARSPLRYEEGHLPNAVNLFIGALMQSRADGAQVLGPPAQLERVFGAAGIAPSRPVVVYGEQGSCDAAYLFWALDYAGHPSVRLLDGGIEAWVHAGQKLTRSVPVVAERDFSLKPDHTKRATGEWVLSHLRDERVVLLDARSVEEFSGQDRRARRGGHIPGARHCEWTRVLCSDLTFKSPKDLCALFEALGVHRDHILVNYCQNGVRSALVYVAQRVAGFPKVCNYDGSWAEWGNNEKYPVESGI